MDDSIRQATHADYDAVNVVFAEVELLHPLVASHMNVNVFGPTKAIVNGTLFEWEFKKDELKDNEKFDLYFDETVKRLKLGDFNDLVKFFVATTGKPELLVAPKK